MYIVTDVDLDELQVEVGDAKFSGLLGSPRLVVMLS
jgi:hypothetical protein